MASGCTNLGAHKKAEWPDPEAKKYFVEKPIFVTQNLLFYHNKGIFDIFFAIIL